MLKRYSIRRAESSNNRSKQNDSIDRCRDSLKQPKASYVALLGLDGKLVFADQQIDNPPPVFMEICQETVNDPSTATGFETGMSYCFTMHTEEFSDEVMGLSYSAVPRVQQLTNDQDNASSELIFISGSWIF